MSEQSIKNELKKLHFESAYKMLNNSSAQNPLLFSMCLRGLYHLEEALEYAQTAKGNKERLEEIKCLFSLGKTKEAISLAQSLYEKDPWDDLLLTYSSLLAETGEVSRALKMLGQIDPDNLKGALHPEYYVLMADLLSFQEKNEEAFTYYEKALSETDAYVPFNWAPLRKMLIHHNTADLYEQLEEFSLGRYHYDQAKYWMKKQKERDETISDLFSYEIELLLSSANCYSNGDEYLKAQADLEAAKNLFDHRPVFQKEYLKARIAYIAGLIEMNEGNSDSAADYFKEAFRLQKELVLKGLDKEEHLARTAYYLASLSQKKEDRLELYNTAQPVFSSVIEKEPTFYISCLAEIENERGKMEEVPSLALKHYENAIQWYFSLLKSHPSDLLSLESRLVCRINRLKIKEDQIQIIEREMESLKNLDPSFLDSLCSYLSSQDLSASFKNWLDDFEKRLPPVFDA